MSSDLEDIESKQMSLTSGDDESATDGNSSRQSNSNDTKASTGSNSATRHDRLVRLTRYLVFVVLTGAAIAVGIETFRIASKQLEKQFETEYESISEEIVEESQVRARNVFSTIQTMSTVASTLAATANETWPFVTLPRFEAWAGGLSFLLTGAHSLALGVIVEENQRGDWVIYSAKQAPTWMQESVNLHKNVELPISSEDAKEQEGDDASNFEQEEVDYTVEANESLKPGEIVKIEDKSDELETRITNYIWQYGPDGSSIIRDTLGGRAVVSWQMTPVMPGLINHNDISSESFKTIFEGMEIDNRPILSMISIHSRSSFLLQPVYRGVDEENATDIVGYFKVDLPWDTYFQRVLAEGKKGIRLVVENTCGQSLTYELDGPEAYFIGEGHVHEECFENMGHSAAFDPLGIFDQPGFKTSGCEYTITVYPSTTYKQGFQSNKPAIYTSIAVIIILVSAGVFLIYDCFVRRRQDQLETSAKRSNAIVNSLFPATVRDRILDNESKNEDAPANKKMWNLFLESKRYSNQIDVKKTTKTASSICRETKPIADFFLNTTILFADIVGFTAWSSVHEPSQVFTLLESIYDRFDQIARKRGVFKVETIGDCYVAVCGLPTPRDDHALVMASFSRKCLEDMKEIVRQLELVLGPGTAELGMRFGLHSGPVMAGVLRGEKSRFQLFGDTMNTASRIEQTGSKNKIHLSQQTADLICQAGKQAWVRPRENLVSAKGKGSLQTYWLNLKPTLESGSHEMQPKGFNDDVRSNDNESNISSFGLNIKEKRRHEKDQASIERQIHYNTEVLARLLKKMVAMRSSSPSPLSSKLKSSRSKFSEENKESSSVISRESSTMMVLDEVKEIITLPNQPAQYNVDPESVELPSEVVAQLRDYVTTIASMYNNNHFHSFHHASHVTMSVMKLLTRVVTPEMIDYNDMTYKTKAKHSSLHEYTFGITSDPLTQFSVGFSALIHDVDHSGVPNAQLVKEGAEVAKAYRNQSVAEQNSVDIAWDLLMEPAYNDLRNYIYTNQAEHDRFRQLIVNAVMATDIADKELGALRRRRWEKAFNPELFDHKESEQDKANRKATIVIEHLIQASDVAHTMQHWHVYLKWNQHLFNEMTSAYLNGRGENDPSENWYQGEIGFFDFYIIPLAKKLKECNVFGVSGDEYLDYALANRKEWELKGREVVQQFHEEFYREYGTKDNCSQSQDAEGCSDTTTITSERSQSTTSEYEA